MVIWRCTHGTAGLLKPARAQIRGKAVDQDRTSRSLPIADDRQVLNLGAAAAADFERADAVPADVQIETLIFRTGEFGGTAEVCRHAGRENVRIVVVLGTDAGDEDEACSLPSLVADRATVANDKSLVIQNGVAVDVESAEGLFADGDIKFILPIRLCIGRLSGIDEIAAERQAFVNEFGKGIVGRDNVADRRHRRARRSRHQAH